MSKSRPVVAIPSASDFNAVVTMDSKEFSKMCILWMICTFTKIIKGMVIKNKKNECVINSPPKGWCFNFGYPSVGFM